MMPATAAREAATADGRATRPYWERLAIVERIRAVAGDRPRATALVDGDLRLDYAGLLARVDAAAARLVALGLRPGERILVQLPNRWESVLLTLACLRCGVVPVLVPPQHDGGRLSTVAGQVRARVAADAPGAAHLLTLAGTDGAALPALCAPPDPSTPPVPPPVPDGDAVAIVALSPGAAGDPVLLSRTHNHYAYCARRAADAGGYGPDTVWRPPAADNGFTPSAPGIPATLLVGGRVVLGSPPAEPVPAGPRPSARLSELADYVVPFTVRAVADLGIADHLATGPRSLAELAELTGTHAPSLYRALRALACRGIFTETAPEVFDLTPLAQPLRGDHPESLRDAYPLLPADIRAWAALGHTLRTGQAAFDHVHGTGYWRYLAEHPEESARFDASQRAVTSRELHALLPAYDWSALRAIVDVGGGNGAFLAGVLARNPSVRGTLFDQPHVVATAPEVLRAHGVADRCAVVGGDFLVSVPAGADAYLLKRILYAWDDDRARTLLRAVRAAMTDDSRLLLIEPLLEPGDTFAWGKLYDMLLLVMAGGGGRSRQCLTGLFADADLEVTRVVPTRLLPILEARPAGHRDGRSTGQEVDQNGDDALGPHHHRGVRLPR